MDKFSMAAFQEACTAPGALCLDVASAGAATPQHVRLQQAFAVLGNHPRAHVRLRDPDLNQRHTYLQVIDGSVFAFDLETRAGTRWGQDARRSGWVAPDSPLGLGGKTVRVVDPARLGDPELDPLAPASLERHNCAALHLEITADQERPVRWTGNRRMFLIGTSQICKVRLHSPEISRIHASVISTPRGTWIVDLLSRSGFSVNGKKTPVARLDPGDQLCLGRFLIHLHAEQPTLDSHGSSPLHPSVEVPGALQKILSGTGTLSGAAGALPPFPGGSHPLMESLVLPLIQQFSRLQGQMFEQFQQNLMMLFQMFQVTQKEQLTLIREELREVQDITLKLNTLQTELAEAQARSAPAAAAPERGRAGVTTNHAEAEQPALNGRSKLEASAPPARAVPQPPPSTTVHLRICERIAQLQHERQNRWQKIMTFLVGK
jgi:pSer/pThr/pTyr-binding forkhead associated (FHA) protein